MTQIGLPNRKINIGELTLPELIELLREIAEEIEIREMQRADDLR